MRGQHSAKVRPTPSPPRRSRSQTSDEVRSQLCTTGRPSDQPTVRPPGRPTTRRQPVRPTDRSAARPPGRQSARPPGNPTSRARTSGVGMAKLRWVHLRGLLCKAFDGGARFPAHSGAGEVPKSGRERALMARILTRIGTFGLASCLLLAADCWPRMTGHIVPGRDSSPSMGHRLLAAEHWPPTTDRLLRAADDCPASTGRQVQA